MKEPAIDLADVLERVQDDQELLMELFEIFLDDFVQKRKQFDDLLRENNAEKIRDLAHSVKGASGNISAKAIYGTCLRMEKNSENGDLSGIPQDLKELDLQFADFKDFVGQIKANPKRFFRS